MTVRLTAWIVWEALLNLWQLLTRRLSKHLALMKCTFKSTYKWFQYSCLCRKEAFIISRTNLGFSRFSLLFCFMRSCWSGNNLIYDSQSFSAGLQRSSETRLSCQRCSQALIWKCCTSKWLITLMVLAQKAYWCLTIGTDLELSAVCSGEIWWLEWSVCRSPDPGKSWCPCL